MLNGFQRGAFFCLCVVAILSTFSEHSSSIDAYATIPLCLIALCSILFSPTDETEDLKGKLNSAIAYNDELSSRFTILYSAHEILLEEALKMREKLDELEQPTDN
jgi:hypothetical protein